jgi:hypothetical protein
MRNSGFIRLRPVAIDHCSRLTQTVFPTQANAIPVRTLLRIFPLSTGTRQSGGPGKPAGSFVRNAICETQRGAADPGEQGVYEAFILARMNVHRPLDDFP